MLALTALTFTFLSPRPGGVLVKIVSFGVEQLPRRSSQSFGPIGLASRDVSSRTKCLCRSAPAPAYACWLSTPTVKSSCACPRRNQSPTRTEIDTRWKREDDVDETDGPGLQAFVAVASRQPLPAFAQWKGSEGLKRLWKSATADGVWRFDGHLPPVLIGQAWQVADSIPARPNRSKKSARI